MRQFAIWRGMSVPRLRDILIGVVAMAAGAGVLALVPREVPGAGLAAAWDMRSPAFFPVLAGLLVIGSGLLIVIANRSAAAAEPQDRPVTPWLAMLGAAGGAALVPLAGIHAGLAGAMLAVGAVLGARPAVLLPVTAVTVVVVHLLFARLLKVVFPDPRLPVPAWWPH